MFLEIDLGHGPIKLVLCIRLVTAHCLGLALVGEELYKVDAELGVLDRDLFDEVTCLDLKGVTVAFPKAKETQVDMIHFVNVYLFVKSFSISSLVWVKAKAESTYHLTVTCRANVHLADLVREASCHRDLHQLFEVGLEKVALGVLGVELLYRRQTSITADFAGNQNGKRKRAQHCLSHFLFKNINDVSESQICF